MKNILKIITYFYFYYFKGYIIYKKRLRLLYYKFIMFIRLGKLLRFVSFFHINIFNVELSPMFLKNMKPIETVTTVEVSNYLGKWNQVATSRSTRLLGTGVKFSNVSAEYTLDDQGNGDNILVYNSGFNGRKEFTSIEGYTYVDIRFNCTSKRKLHFDGVPFDGNYWIIKLGPIIDEQYQYAVVSGPVSGFFGTRFSLYVLARNRDEYKKYYEQEVKKWCKENNFVFFWNKYVPTD